ncbi:hypothetical protein MKK64_04800 [Methylobacterium sp. E-025]|uniref:hypothetical protein n=1 Tax=Methylobacterium sp. E-025 TaxID=2836561 RepID=UPI001FBB8CC3|nr:hypothetical protein [Methylobacterium sp. E-025]MCJ2110526.1 hypothetical protein [Methylobacterium sp. E-025]
MIRFAQVATFAALIIPGATPILAAEAYVPQAAIAQAGDVPVRLPASPLLAAPVTLASAQATAASRPAGNTAQVVQIGSYNNGMVSQTGMGNVAALNQQGQGNVAVISQTGRSR